MANQSYQFSPSATNATRFVSNATGGTWTLTLTTTGDSLAHKVTIHNDAAVDHSDKTALLTGTDINGAAITETLTLPAGLATSTSTQYFLTLTSVVPSATIGTDTMDVGISSAFVTTQYVLDRENKLGTLIEIYLVSGTMTAIVDTTADDPTWDSNTAAPFTRSIQSTYNWIADNTFAGVTSSKLARLACKGLTLMRFRCSAVGSGTVINLNIIT